MSFEEQQLKERIKQQAEREAQRKALAKERAVQEVFDKHPDKFKVPPDEILRMIGGSVRVDVDGIPRTSDGRLLSDALVEVSKGVPHAVAGSIHEQHDKGLSSVRSKQGFKSVQEKVQFIDDQGLAAWEALDSSPKVPFDPDSPDATWEKFKGLKAFEKAKLAGTHPDLAAKLLAKEQEYVRLQRLAGVPLDKVKPR
jgi:hypothetical protein